MSNFQNNPFDFTDYHAAQEAHYGLGQNISPPQVNSSANRCRTTYNSKTFSDVDSVAANSSSSDFDENSRGGPVVSEGPGRRPMISQAYRPNLVLNPQTGMPVPPEYAGRTSGTIRSSRGVIIPRRRPVGSAGPSSRNNGVVGDTSSSNRRANSIQALVARRSPLGAIPYQMPTSPIVDGNRVRVIMTDEEGRLDFSSVRWVDRSEVPGIRPQFTDMPSPADPTALAPVTASSARPKSSGRFSSIPATFTRQRVNTNDSTVSTKSWTESVKDRFKGKNRKSAESRPTVTQIPARIDRDINNLSTSDPRFSHGIDRQTTSRHIAPEEDQNEHVIRQNRRVRNRYEQRCAYARANNLPLPPLPRYQYTLGDESADESIMNSSASSPSPPEDKGKGKSRVSSIPPQISDESFSSFSRGFENYTPRRIDESFSSFSRAFENYTPRRIDEDTLLLDYADSAAPPLSLLPCEGCGMRVRGYLREGKCFDCRRVARNAAQ